MKVKILCGFKVSRNLQLFVFAENVVLLVSWFVGPCIPQACHDMQILGTEYGISTEFRTSKKLGTEYGISTELVRNSVLSSTEFLIYKYGISTEFRS